MTEMTVTAKEVQVLIDEVGPSPLGCDYTDTPVFPKGRTDVCAVRRATEDGTSYGFDTVYLVWKEPDGTLKHEEIKNSRSTEDYIHIELVEVNEDGGVSVSFVHLKGERVEEQEPEVLTFSL